MSKNISHLSGRQGLKNNLFEKIGHLSEHEGTLSQQQKLSLAEEYLVGKANITGTISAYDFAREDNRGKKAFVCNGSACMLAGTQDAVRKKLGEHLKEEEIGNMTCLGRCHENSAFNYGGTNYSALSDAVFNEVMQNKKPKLDDYFVGHNGLQILTDDFPGLDTFYSTLKESLAEGPDAVLQKIKNSGVRGRGGAGFSMGFKLEACKNEAGDEKYIVCNADEGDPGAYSDRYLLEKQPHLVIFGMIMAGYTVGANWGIIYTRAEYPESVDIVQNALDQLYDLNILGENIMGSEFSYDLKVVKGLGAYICGEETALLNSLEGQRPEVRTRPPYPTQQGLFNKPTVVNNVETLATLHYILTHTGKKYATHGTEKSTGTKLVCLDSFFNRPGMYEVEMGTPLRVVIDDLGGGFKQPVKAMHIGGPLGGLVPLSKIDDLSIDFESFSQEGFLLGHASVICIPEDYPLVHYIEHLFEFTSHESCGKCFPCRLGSKRGQEMFNKAQNEDYKMDRELLDDLIDTMERGSLCALGGGLPLPIKNALHYFEDELKHYFN